MSSEDSTSRTSVDGKIIYHACWNCECAIPIAKLITSTTGHLFAEEIPIEDECKYCGAKDPIGQPLEK